MNVAVLVPRRADNGRRDRIWAHVKERWERNHPDWPIYEGHHDAGPFNRSAAVNRAAEQAGDFDIAIIADSDSFTEGAQAVDAVRLAADSGQIVFAYDRFAYLNRRMSDKVMDWFTGNWWPGVEWTMTGTCSSQVVVTRAMWDEVGGFDEGFVGWGMEDVAFSLACQALGDGMQRIHGEVWHLHHPTASNTPTGFEANVARMKRYEACDYQPDRMRALLEELR